MRPVTGLFTSLVSLAVATTTFDTCDEVPSVRSFFFVGGEYAQQGNNPSTHVFVNQMYVEKLAPVGGATQELPVVFFHGRGQMGTNLLNTPDGRRGWASHFLAAGYEVYLADEPFRGRSPWEPGSHNTPLLKTYPAELIQQRFTAVADYNLWPQAKLHTQWPGTGVMGDPVFDAFYAANIQFFPDPAVEQAATQAAGAALLDHIKKPVVLIGHSQGGPLPLLVADKRPDLAAALILLEPAGPPFHEAVFSNTTARRWGTTEIAMTYDPPVTDPDAELVKAVRTFHNPERLACTVQADGNDHPPPRRLTNFADKRILVVTSEASYHQVYDHCTVEYLRQAGCAELEHVYLQDKGIQGNGHMMFMEKNSHEIQTFLQAWIERL